jgi:hypothetical protein
MVVVVMLFALTHRSHAAMGHFAFLVLELDGGVVDAEVLMQALLRIAQDALAGFTPRNPVRSPSRRDRAI